MIDVKRLAVDAGYWDEVAPEGATHAIPKRGYNATGVVWFKRVSGSDWKVWSRYDTGSFLRWCDSAGTSDGPHFIPRPRPQPEWVDGLPPAGCECEGRADPGYPWLRGVIMYSSPDGAVFKPNDGGRELFWLYRTRNAEFRPIPTPEQREREDWINRASKAAGFPECPATRKVCADIYDGLIESKGL